MKQMANIDKKYIKRLEKENKLLQKININYEKAIRCLFASLNHSRIDDEADEKEFKRCQRQFKLDIDCIFFKNEFEEQDYHELTIYYSKMYEEFIEKLEKSRNI